jgi:hypothetical protein
LWTQSTVFPARISSKTLVIIIPVEFYFFETRHSAGNKNKIENLKQFQLQSLQIDCDDDD